ncbi:hypothetical protein [Variovorax boronicumulans]|uniref:hypothetical protein n=1 Tax=Variovorax boronicumulans TaxID=436515 RepID=UPI00339761EF
MHAQDLLSLANSAASLRRPSEAIGSAARNGATLQFINTIAVLLVRGVPLDVAGTVSTEPRFAVAA